MKFLKYSLFFLFLVLLLWGALVLFMPKDDDDFHVVLDPGHGGEDPGAVVGEIYEKDINLSVALLVHDILSAQDGVTVSMTRNDDSFPSLSERAEFANREGADLYVSIHANALDDETYSGLFTFYHPNKRSSKEIAELIQDSASNASGAINRGVRSENYVVLRETDMPAVLVETGFMTCPEELSLLIDDEYQTKIAKGISEGILAFISK